MSDYEQRQHLLAKMGIFLGFVAVSYIATLVYLTRIDMHETTIQLQGIQSGIKK